ncbi:MAG: MFS transporter [Lachnospiraceae bacterium]
MVVIAIPMAIFGMIRFLVVKERHRSDMKVSQKFTVKEMFQLLKQNKYILIFALIIALANFGTNFTNSTSTYYYKYVMGDIGIGSIMSLSMVSMVFAIGITPLIMVNGKQEYEVKEQLRVHKALPVKSVRHWELVG